MGRGFAPTPEAMQFVHQMHALKRTAQPEEIAQSALYLASSASSFTTGAVLLDQRPADRDGERPYVTPAARSQVGPVESPHVDQRARGQQVASVPIHSLRRPGVIARQETILSGPGESLMKLGY